MVSNQRGAALVTVILLLTVLLTLAHILSEKIWQSTHLLLAADNREQVFWAAQAGIETARLQLAADYVNSAGWHNLLMADVAQEYPAAPNWQIEINGTPVEIYLRDNPDGDGDVQNDNDLKLFVLARARGRRGAEAVIESLCGFDLSNSGDAATRASTGTEAGADLADQPVSTYGIAD